MMSPYEQARHHFRMAGYAGWTQENFAVFAVGLLLAHQSAWDPQDQQNWAWGFLAAYNQHQQWRKEQLEGIEREKKTE